MIDRVAETKSFVLLSEAGLGPACHGTFQNGRLEHFFEGFRTLTYHHLSVRVISTHTHTDTDTHTTHTHMHTCTHAVTLSFSHAHLHTHGIGHRNLMQNCSRAGQKSPRHPYTGIPIKQRKTHKHSHTHTPCWVCLCAGLMCWILVCMYLSLCLCGCVSVPVAASVSIFLSLLISRIDLLSLLYLYVC